MKRYIYLLLSVFSFGFVFSGCDDEDDVRNGNISVVGISSDSDKKYISIEDNNTLQLEAFIMPKNKTSKVTYALTGTKSGAIEITPDGLITPLVKTPAEGDIPSPLGVDTILLTLDNDPSIFVKYPVRVYSHIKLVTSITLQSAGQFPEIKMGKTFDLSQYVTINPANATEKGVTYTSSDESIATVDANGIITAKAIGEATIIIKTIDVRSGDISAECKVTIKDDVINYVDLDRTGWTVTTQTHNSYGYMWDGGTQAAHITGLPEHMFDGQSGSYLSLVKPGGTLNGVTPPADSTPPSFIVDMKAAQEFEYVRWAHRNGSYTNAVGTVSANIYNYLRVFGVIIEGSNDGANFTTIAPSEPAGSNSDIVWIPQKASYVAAATSTEDTSYTIPVTKSTYRYVKVNLVVNSFNYKTDKYQHPDYPGNGYTTGGQSMQVAEFGLGNIVIE